MASVARAIIVFLGIIFIVAPVTEHFWPGRSIFTLAVAVAVFCLALDRAESYVRARLKK